MLSIVGFSSYKLANINFSGQEFDLSMVGVKLHMYHVNNL
jgi:hypothetical protein